MDPQEINAPEELKDSENKLDTNQETSSEEHHKKKEKHKHSESENEKLQEMGEKLAETNDKYLRLYSEFDNYRKRTAKEKIELVKSGGEDILKVLLPVIDDFERALQSMGEDDVHKEGIALIYNKLIKNLEQKGLKPIEALNCKFDENIHEAITQIPATDPSQKGMVVDVLEKGYFLNDKVIRYSKVVVAN